MASLKYLPLALLMAGLASTQRGIPGGIVPSSLDPSSFANIDVIQTRHIELNVTINMDIKQIFGICNLTLQAVQDASEVVLDYQGIDIAWIKYVSPATGELIAAAYDTHKDIHLGNAVRIYLTDKVVAGSFLELHV